MSQPGLCVFVAAPRQRAAIWTVKSLAPSPGYGETGRAHRSGDSAERR
jgi:hypothetical protein